MQISSVNLPWRLRHMLGLLALKFKQPGISFPDTFVFSWEKTLFSVLSTQHWICAQCLSRSTYTIFIYIKRKTEMEKKNNQNNNLRNTIKKTVATAAPEEKHSKRGSLEAKDQLRRQKCSALRLWAAKFPTLSLSLGICTIKKAYKLIKPYFMLLLENTWGKLLFCNVCPGKRKRQTSFYMCILFYSIAEMTKIVQGEGGWCSPWVPIDSSGAGGYTFIYASWETRPGVLIIQTTLNPDLLFPRNKGSEMEGQTA